MNVSPDLMVLWRFGPLVLNATIAYTWLVMALLVLVAFLVGRRLTHATQPSRWQLALEVVVSGIRDQIREISHDDPARYIAFVGTLFLFVALSNLLAVVPGYVPPTASLSTTAALALTVFFAVPIYGIAAGGVRGYFRHYLRPTWLMLPFNIIGELSRTLALAVRLYGNIMSGALIAAILLTLAPFFFPVVMHLLGLVTGVIQAYIFAVLAMVYIASASAAHEEGEAAGATAGT